MIKRHKSLFSLTVSIIIVALIPLFVQSPYYLSLLIAIIVDAILAMTFVIMLRTGLLSLGISAFWGMGAYASAMLVTKLHMSFWLSLPASALITGGIALVLGYPLIRSPGFSFAILTSVVGMLFTIAIGNIPFLGGYSGITNIPPPNPIQIPFLTTIEFVSKVEYLYLALFLLVVVVLIYNAFYSSSVGRAWTAIRLSGQLAESLGINVFRYKLLSFILACGISGLIGSFYAHYTGFVIPTTFSMFKTLDVTVRAVLGGVDFVILGPLVGSALLTFFTESMRFTSTASPIFKGALLVLLMIFLPRGLLNVSERWTVVAKRVSKIGKAIGSSLSIRSKANKE